MFTAINSSGEKVYIDEAVIGDNYYCPVCSQRFIIKRGNIRIHHFAHDNPRGCSNYITCTDRWNYDKTEWHKEWQKRFPVDNIEVVVSNGNKKHLADVLINNIVIEFQHSRIKYEEFRERNEFYTKSGYKVIWIFDVCDYWNNNKTIYNHSKENEYKWDNPSKEFRQMSVKEEDATIYFQFDNSDTDKVLERIKSNYNNFKTFYTDKNNPFTINEFVNAVINNNTNIHKKDYVSSQNEIIKIENGQTIRDLCNSNYTGIIVENMMNGDFMCINIYNGNPKMSNKYVIGNYAKKRINENYYDLKKDKEYVVKDADKPIWKLIKIFYVTEEMEAKRKAQNEKKEQERLQRIKEENEKYKKWLEEEEKRQRVIEQERERKIMEEAKRIEQERQLLIEKRKKEEEEFKKEISAKIKQQDKIVKDKYGNRYVLCEYCGEIKMGNEFIFLGGPGRNNLGKCRKCDREGKKEKLPEIEKLISDKSELFFT